MVDTHTQKQMLLLTNNNQLEIRIEKDTILVITAKTLQSLGINLIKDVHTFMKEIRKCYKKT